MHSTVETALDSRFETYRIERKRHDVAPHAVYEVVVDGQRAVCKVDTHPEGSAETEGRLLRRVERQTSLPVPRVLGVGPGWFVGTWLDAVPETEPERPLSERVARALGRAQARCHEETAGLFDRTGLFETTQDGLALQGQDAWRETVLAVLERRRQYLADIGYGNVAARVIDFIESRPEFLPEPSPPVVCHGNFLPAHVGFRTVDGEPRLDAVIDFEHALVGPAEYDCWRTVLPVFRTAEREQDEAFAAFREGYTEVRPLPSGFDRGRECYTLVNTVSYLRSLDLQNDGIGPAEREQADGMAAWIADRLETLS